MDTDDMPAQTATKKWLLHIKKSKNLLTKYIITVTTDTVGRAVQSA